MCSNKTFSDVLAAQELSVRSDTVAAAAAGAPDANSYSFV